MFYGTSTDLSVPLPITQTARETAEEFARQQPTAAKAEQVYRNTLAVCLVNNYLRMLGIETDPAASDSWNPVMRLSDDVADLYLPGQGKIECRAIAPHQSACPIPEDIQDDRIGYVLVQIDDECQDAALLGFAEQAGTALPRKQLQSMEALLDCLNSAEETQSVVVSNLTDGITCLSQWLRSVFEAGWQTPEVFFGLQPAYSRDRGTWRKLPVSEIERIKPVTLGDRPNSQQFALLVGLNPKSGSVVDVRVVVAAPDGCSSLPPGLEVKVLDENQKAVMQAESRSTPKIELSFGVDLGDRFSIQVNLNHLRITEAFAI